MGILTKRVRLRGLNRRLLSVCTDNILFLEEAELDGNLITNVHFHNGKWVTSALSLNEVESLLDSASDEISAAQRERWAKIARERALADAEINEITKKVADKVAGFERKSWNITNLPDGTMKAEIIFEKEKKDDTTEISE